MGATKVAVADESKVKDLRLEVDCKPVSGKADQACGLVFRYQDENNYYVARANALEDNVRLYHVVRGKRGQFAGWNGKVAGQAWHALAVEARGNRFQVFFDGKAVIDAKDDTFQDAGKVGVWTKADSVTWFSGLSLKPHQ
ncbi:MAG: family 16 glycoside hydrolase [Myxococcales bacterium]